MLISSDMIGKIINDEIHNKNFWNETIKHVSNSDIMKNFLVSMTMIPYRQRTRVLRIGALFEVENLLGVKPADYFIPSNVSFLPTLLQFLISLFQI